MLVDGGAVVRVGYEAGVGMEDVGAGMAGWPGRADVVVEVDVGSVEVGVGALWYAGGFAGGGGGCYAFWMEGASANGRRGV